MYEIETEIEIETTPEALWAILMGFPEYPKWNPFIRSIEGVAGEGQHLNLTIEPPGSKAMTIRPRLLAVASGRELRWLGRLLLPGLFDGEHYLQIVPLTTGRVKFIQGEKFSGILVWTAKSGLLANTKKGFAAMNEALKSRAEGHRSL